MSKLRKGKKGRRVLVITERFYPEEFLINELVQEWCVRGLSITVLTQFPSYPAAKVYAKYGNPIIGITEELGIKVVRFHTILGYKRSVYRKILNYINFMVWSFAISIILAAYNDAVFIYHTGPLSQAVAVPILKKFFRLPTSIWTQDVWPDTVFSYGFSSEGLLAEALKTFVRFVYSGVDNIAVTSPGFIKRVEPYLRKTSTINFIPQWVPANIAYPDMNYPVPLDKTSFNFTFAGNIGRMQNLVNVIEGFNIAHYNCANIALNIIGDGSERHMLERKYASSTKSAIRFWGRIDSSEIRSWLDASDCLILSLVDDELIQLTIPAKFQAYLSSGKPILTVAKGEVAGLVEREKLGLVASPTDKNEISCMMLAIKEFSAAERAGIKRKMTEMLRKEYSKDICVERLLQNTGCILTY